MATRVAALVQTDDMTFHVSRHRWGARIGARRNGKEYVLTGREHGHWSYFPDSGGSPLEGNYFAKNKPFATDTPELRLNYTALDLYLMGLIGPEAVGPIRLLEGGKAEGTDCNGIAISSASPPQTCEPKTLKGTWTTLGIEDVIEFEGPRVPEVADAPKNLTNGFFVFGSVGERWKEEACERVVSAIAGRLDDFRLATGQRMKLANAVGAQLSCAELSRLVVANPEAEPEPTVASGCSVPRARQRANGLWAVTAVLACAFALRRRYSNFSVACSTGQAATSSARAPMGDQDLGLEHADVQLRIQRTVGFATVLIRAPRHGG